MTAPVETKPANKGRPRGIIVVAILTILFGLAEIKSGLTHNFVGLTTSHAEVSTYLGTGLGVLYILAGVLILIGKRWAATLAIILLAADVVGRVTMVVAGFYPLNSFLQTFAILVGTSIAAFFAIYIGRNMKSFQS